MKQYPYIKGNRRDWIRRKRKAIKVARKVWHELRTGCALQGLFDGTNGFKDACDAMENAIDKMDEITKPLA